MRWLTPHRPSPVTSARGLPGGLRVFGTALPAPGLLRGGDTVWLLTAPGRASWLQSQLAAAWARSPASLGPRSGCLRPTPQSRDFLFLFPLFSLWWQIWVSFLAFPSFLPFFFLLQREESGGGGVAWRALKKKKNVLVQQLQFCEAGTAQQGPLLSPPRPQFVAGCPRTSVPLSLVSWPSPPPWRVSPQLRRLGHCSWLLAELWKPPRLNAAPADVTAACDQSAARGPSVNHSASPGRGECRETAFRGSVAAASAAGRGAGGGQRGARAPPAPVRPRFRWEGLRARE